MSELTFRTLTNTTAAELTELHPIVATQHPLQEYRDTSVWVDRELARAEPKYVVAYPANAAGQPVGFAMVETHGAGEPIVSVDVWVTPDQQRQGIGTALVNQVAATHPDVALISVVTTTGTVAQTPQKSAGYEFAVAVDCAQQTTDTVHAATPALAKATLKSVALELKAAHPDIRVKSHTDAPPEELMYQIALAYRAVWDSNAPDPDSVDDGFVQECAERFNEALQAAENEGFTPLITTATDPSGNLLGFLVVDIPETDDEPLLVGNAMTSPELSDSVESAMVVSALRSCVVLFPGLAGFEVFVEGDAAARVHLRSTLAQVGFALNTHRTYFARSSQLARDDAAAESENSPAQ